MGGKKFGFSLGDCLSALTARVPSTPPFTNSMLTALLSDSVGEGAKVVLMVTCSPGQRDAGESVGVLQYAQRARNVELTLGSKDSIKKWRDTVRGWGVGCG